tara:strand:- start:19607 stop:20635 length:1029 start_codon:yes stop_codon:yes gene_type:complete
MEHPYLCVDEFLTGVVETRALVTAFEEGVVDALVASSQPVPVDELRPRKLRDPKGLGLLLDILRANRVVTIDSDGVSLTASFRNALKFRDLLEVKAEFALFFASDWVDRFDLLLGDPAKLMEQSQVMKLFDYAKAFNDTPQNYEHTRRWMRLTTTLTRYEAEVIAPTLALDSFREMLDVGGNSGEFALRCCKRAPTLRATVFDLPLVCQIGREHVARHEEADRIQFLNAKSLSDLRPKQYDLVTFKSMLHDWPNAEAKDWLQSAVECLQPGGTLLIFERVAWNLEARHLGFSMIPILLFHRFYREATFYEEFLVQQGLTDLECRIVNLDTPFLCLTAKKQEN